MVPQNNISSVMILSFVSLRACDVMLLVCVILPVACVLIALYVSQYIGFTWQSKRNNSSAPCVALHCKELLWSFEVAVRLRRRWWVSWEGGGGRGAREAEGEGAEGQGRRKGRGREHGVTCRPTHIYTSHTVLFGLFTKLSTAMIWFCKHADFFNTTDSIRFRSNICMFSDSVWRISTVVI